MSREHNNANILAVGGRVVVFGHASEIVRAWIQTNFLNEERHVRRIEKISTLESSYVEAMLCEKDFLKLQNGSDVRGVSQEGIVSEPVNLTAEAVNRIASSFAKLLSDKLGKSVRSLKISVGHDSRICINILD